MSGRKRILVDESEWYRLKREETKLGRIIQGLPKVVDGVRRQVEADLARMSETVERRQRATDQMIEKLGEQTRQLEAETDQRLREHARSTATQLADLAGELRQETGQRLAEQDRALRAEIDASRQRTRGELKALASRVDALAQDAEEAATAARNWLADATALHDLIATTLPHERHAPGELARLRAKLRTAADDIGKGVAGPLLGLVQSLYHDLSNLRVDVELADRQRRLAQATASSACAYLAELIAHNRQQPVRDGRGEALPGLFLDVDHWSGGQLTALGAAVAGTTRTVRDETDPLTSDQLRRVLDQELPGYEQRLAGIIEYAARQQIASQLRVNLADAVVDTLDEVAGYELVDGDYAGRDERAAFYAKLRHQNGNEIVVDVSPAEEDPTRPVLRVHSYDHDIASAAVLDERGRAITAGLRARGIAAGSAQEEAAGPDQSLRDIEALRRADPARDGAAPAGPTGTTWPPRDDDPDGPTGAGVG